MAAFGTQNTTLNAFDAILKGPFLYRWAEAYRQRTFKIDSLQVSVTENTWSRTCACIEWDKNYKNDVGYILYDGHFMEKYIPHVYIFTGLKIICLVSFFFFFFYLPLSLLQQNKLRPWRHVVSSKLLKSQNRIKQINTFITDNRHLIKKWTLSVSVCTNVDGGEASRFLRCFFCGQWKNQAAQNTYNTFLKQTKIN